MATTKNTFRNLNEVRQAKKIARADLEYEINKLSSNFKRVNDPVWDKSMKAENQAVKFVSYGFMAYRGYNVVNNLLKMFVPRKAKTLPLAARVSSMGMMAYRGYNAAQNVLRFLSLFRKRR